MKKVTMLLAGLLVFGVVGPVVAGPTDTPKIDARLERQAKRIEQGVKSGKLTPAEADALKAEQEHIKQEKVRVQEDGKVTKRERATLNKMLNQASKNIKNQKSN